MPRTKAPANYHVFPLSSDPDFLRCTPKQQKFLFGYFLKPLTGKSNLAIYREAFGKGDKRSNETSVSKLVNTNEKIKRCLAKLADHAFRALNISAQQILNEEKTIAFSDVAQYFDDSGYLVVNPKTLPERVRRAISSITVVEDKAGQIKYQVRLWNKGDSLKRLQAIAGMMAPTKHEISGPEGKPIQVDMAKEYDLTALTDDELIEFKRLLEKARC